MSSLKISIPSTIPLISTCFLMLGNGLYNTLVSLRLKSAGEADIIIGLITSIYYLGMFVGSFNLASIITRIGHIRAFAAFAAALAISTLVTGMEQNIILWFITRFIGGYSLAGLYITIESWLLNLSDRSTRGKYVALYMIMLYGGQSGGQFFLRMSDFQTIMPFALATILTMIAIIPISMTVSKAPHIESPQTLSFKELYKISPTGIIGCFISGIMIASTYGLLPVYLRENGFSVNEIAILIATTIFGGVALQYPLGHLSDLVDRRIVLIALSVLGVAVSISMMVFSYYYKVSFVMINIISFIFGGMVFSIYPISMSHTCDFVKPSHIVEATQGMLLFYGIGSVLGPIIVSYAMSFGHQGFFISVSCAVMLFGLIASFRMFSSEKAIEATDTKFVPDTRTTPIPLELDIDEHGKRKKD